MTFSLRLFFIFLFSDNTIFDEQESKIILTLYSNIIRRKKEFHTPRNKIRPITNIDKLSRTVFDKRFKRIEKAIIFPNFLYFLNTKIPKHSLRIEFQIIPFFSFSIKMAIFFEQRIRKINRYPVAKTISRISHVPVILIRVIIDQVIRFNPAKSCISASRCLVDQRKSRRAAMNRARRKFREWWWCWSGNGSLLLDKSIRRDLFFPDFREDRSLSRRGGRLEIEKGYSITAL